MSHRGDTDVNWAEWQLTRDKARELAGQMNAWLTSGDLEALLALGWHPIAREVLAENFHAGIAPSDVVEAIRSARDVLEAIGHE